MLKSDNFLRVLAIPYSALVSVIFGVMLLSFPIGAYVIFNSDVGKEINFEYPLDGLNVFLGGLSFKLPLKFEIGEAFTVLCCVYIILFSISIVGPNGNMVAVIELADATTKELSADEGLTALKGIKLYADTDLIIDHLGNEQRVNHITHLSYQRNKLGIVK